LTVLKTCFAGKVSTAFLFRTSTLSLMNDTLALCVRLGIITGPVCVWGGSLDGGGGVQGIKGGYINAPLCAARLAERLHGA